MKRRQLFILMIAFDLLIALAALYYFVLRDTEKTDQNTFPAEASAYVDVIMAVDELPRGTRLTESLLSGETPALGIRQVAESAKPPNALDPAMLPELINAVIRIDIPRESILTTADILTHPLLNSSLELAPPVPFEDTAAPLTGDFSETPLQAIFPDGLDGGDRVDIVVSSAEQVELWREDVLVGRVEDGQPRLWLTPTDAQILTQRLESGASVTLLLRSVGDTSALGETVITRDELEGE